MRFPSETDRTKVLAALFAAAVMALGFWAYLVVRMGESDLLPADNRVNDHAAMCDLDSAERIDRVSRGVAERTGIDLLVVTIPQARPYATDEYASRLVRRHTDAHPDSKGAILLLVSKAEGRINVEVSPTIDFVLPKSTGAKILEDHVVPMFMRANEESGKALAGKPAVPPNELVGKGLREGVNAIAQRVSDISKLEIFSQQLKTATARRDAVTSEELRRRRVYIFSAIAATILILLFALYRIFVVRCPKCGFRVRPQSTVIEIPTRAKPGLTVRHLACRRCGYTENERVVAYYRRFLLATVASALAGMVKSWSRRRRRSRRKSG